MSEKQSISDTLEKHTMEVMKKFDSQLPLHIKAFSDFSREYVKLLKQTFEINYSIENKVFGNIEFDKNSIKLLDDCLNAGSKFYTAQIDTATEFFKSYLNMRLTMMESYNKFVSEFTKGIKSTNSENKDVSSQ